ncbi:MAG: DUF4412 domain-containing protein [Nitrospiraceae bacterium]|nr:DUF4412 domain-containing protein [Nitrospiraceae bacterium]
MRKPWPVVFALTLILTALILMPSAASAGLYELDQEGNRTYVSSGRIKYMPASKEEFIIIFNAAKGAITQIDPEKKLYSEGSLDEYCDAVNSRIDAILKTLPGEQREKIEEAMSGGNTPDVEVSEGGAGERIAGYDTEKYKVTVNGTVYEEVWIARDKALLKEINEFNSKWKRKFDACTSKAFALAGVPNIETSKKYQELQNSGWEMKTNIYRGGQLLKTIQAEKLEERDIPESEFSAPAGYKKVPVSLMMGLGGKL